MMTWIFIGSSSMECPAINPYFALGYHRCSALVPLCMCVVGYLTSSATDHPIRKLIILSCGGLSMFGYFARAWVLPSMEFPEHRHCGFVGPCGHLDLHLSALNGLFHQWTFLFPLAVLACVLRPADGRKYNWASSTTVLNGVGIGLLIWLWGMFKQCSVGEIGSIWCWSCSSLCLWFWFETRVYCWLIDPWWAPKSEGLHELMIGKSSHESGKETCLQGYLSSKALTYSSVYLSP